MEVQIGSQKLRGSLDWNRLCESLEDLRSNKLDLSPFPLVVSSCPFPLSLSPFPLLEEMTEIKWWKDILPPGKQATKK